MTINGATTRIGVIKETIPYSLKQPLNVIVVDILTRVAQESLRPSSEASLDLIANVDA